MSELKYRGLLERVSSIVTKYEDEIATLRVELTTMLDRVENLEEENRTLYERIEGLKSTEDTDTT